METNKEYTKDRAIIGLYSESAGEYSLADYNGDVKKILMVNTRVIPSGKFIDGDNAEFSGVVSYDVVYLDGENGITHCEFTTDYDIAVRCSGENYIDADIDTTVSNYSVRLVGPRKFSVKATLQSDVHISEHASLEMSGDAFETEEPEVLTKDINIRHTVFGKNSEREYAEELERLDGAISDEVEVLCSNCDVKIETVSMMGNGVEHKGELSVSALVKCGDEVPHVVKKSIPFSDLIICDQLDDDMYVTTSVYITSLKCTVTPDDDGVSITVSIIAESKLRASGNVPLRLVKDSFLTDRECVNEHSELSYTEFVVASEISDSFSTELTRGDVGAENVRNFLVTSAKPRVDDITVLDDSVKIKGEIRFSGIACEVNEDGDITYTGIRIDTPFEKNVNYNCQLPDNSRVECLVSALDSAIELDNTSVFASCRLSIKAVALNEARASYVSSSFLGDEEYDTDDSVVTVYYPEEGESLFDIAKKYHKSVMTIAGANALSESVFMSMSSPAVSLGVKKLIIR